jgi:CHAT domain-containing protein/Tfp pilus assembly protein PilF
MANGFLFRRQTIDGLTSSLQTRVAAGLAIAFCASAFLAVARQSAPQGPDSPVLLKPGAPIEHELSGTRKDFYQIDLKQGELALVSVEQRGVDVEVQLVGRNGNPILRADNEAVQDREERLEIFAEAAGIHTITVHAAYPRVGTGAYRIRLAEVRPATVRDRELHESRKLRTEALHLLQENRDAEAVPVAVRALAGAERVLDSGDIYLGRLLWTVGMAHEEVFDHTSAHRYLARAFDVLASGLGPDHPQTTYVQNRLGMSYIELGDRATAERLILDALRRQEATLGSGHPIVAFTLRSLAILYVDRGDFNRAERAIQRASAIVAEWLGTDHEQYGILENNLGVLYNRQRDYERAEPHFRRAMEIQEKLLGPDHAQLAVPLNNLGIIAREKGDYATAERYFLRTLAIREKTVGLDHPSVAGTLNNLANVYSAQGDYARSLGMLLRALAIDEKHASRWEQPILTLGNIARRYAALGDFANALKYQSRVDAALEDAIALNLVIGSERQKIAYLNTIAERTDRTVSFHLGLQPENPEAARLAARVLLQRKGRVLDAMADTLAALRLRAGPEEGVLLDRLAETTAHFAQLALFGPGKTPVEEHRRTLQQLEETREKVEVEVSQRSDEFRAASQRLTLDSVQGAMPAGAALVEFAVYRPFNAKATSMSVAYDSPRYAVYVVKRDGTVGRDLGEAAAIDAAIEEFRAALQDPRRHDLRRVARALDEKIMQPVRAVAADATRLLVSPDGQLALIPLEALIDERGQYLVQRYPVSYVSAGRDVLRMQVPRASRSGPLVLAAPLFGEPGVTAPTTTSAGQAAPAARGRRSITSGADLRSMYFAPLAGTLQEARSIRSVFPDVQVLSGGEATESALRQVQAPRILHIATHGFFLQDADRATSAATRAPVSGTRGIQAEPARIENPLLRSGLALAGANLTSAGKDDGILTALEAAQLNLWGTKLVVLSACDTGVGVVRNGDGVYGLRRSIFLAGAETLVMSLWPVSDYVTREMMTAYYKGLKDGLGRGDALRQVQLSMLKRKGREHPFYWASFIQAGEWANLEGNR